MTEAEIQCGSGLHRDMKTQDVAGQKCVYLLLSTTPMTD